MRRAAVSVTSNIAEGYERDTDPEAVRYFRIAKGSLGELLTQADIARAVGFIKDDSFVRIEGLCLELSAMLGKFIATRLKK
jgi:four helix bundle protein